mmetsp:Transcript_664/g.1353  ORF Transcript_664/g.1353 Transcript_664/m.1353 type:complete len:222 (-) Transcript_664:3-668(-)
MEHPGTQHAKYKAGAKANEGSTKWEKITPENHRSAAFDAVVVVGLLATTHELPATPLRFEQPWPEAKLAASAWNFVSAITPRLILALATVAPPVLLAFLAVHHVRPDRGTARHRLMWKPPVPQRWVDRMLALSPERALMVVAGMLRRSCCFDLLSQNGHEAAAEAPLGVGRPDHHSLSRSRPGHCRCQQAWHSLRYPTLYISSAVSLGSKMAGAAGCAKMA